MYLVMNSCIIDPNKNSIYSQKKSQQKKETSLHNTLKVKNA